MTGADGAPAVRVYLDAAPVIYAVEQVPGYGAAVDTRLAAPGLVPVTSELTRLECRVKPLREGDLLAVRRLAWDSRTRAETARRTAQGKTKPELLRCLKRSLARKLYPLLTCPPTPPSAAPEAPPLAA